MAISASGEEGEARLSVTISASGGRGCSEIVSDN